MRFLLALSLLLMLSVNAADAQVINGSNNGNGFGIVLPPATPQHVGPLAGGNGSGKGILGGAQIGYNWQMNSLVAGIETDIQAAGIRGAGVPAGAMGTGNNGAAQFVAANANSRIDWLHEGHQQTLVDPTGGSLAEVPELPPGSDAGLTAAWIRRVLDGTVPVPAPIATQVEAIRECLKLGTRVTWASPV